MNKTMIIMEPKCIIVKHEWLIIVVIKEEKVASCQLRLSCGVVCWCSMKHETKGKFISPRVVHNVLC